MRKIYLLMALATAVAAPTMNAQKKGNDEKRWEEAEARKITPEVRTFVTPMVCEMQMLSKTRETYGPYTFQISSVENTYNYELTNYQNRALYRACQEADADAIIEPLFNSSVYSKDSKTLVVELSGYPVRYVNFHPASADEVGMIGVVYPSHDTSVSVQTGTNSNQATPAQNTQPVK